MYFDNHIAEYDQIYKVEKYVNTDEYNYLCINKRVITDFSLHKGTYTKDQSFLGGIDIGKTF